jgi:glycosyltransferase involved in cell wall biosynthesis
MKVALVDNMNNNFFALARYFRDLGLEADLYLIPGRSQLHFEPKEDTWQDLRNVSWIKEFPLGYGPCNYLRPIKRNLSQIFDKYDKIIACGASLSLFYKANINVDLFIPFGSDLINLPFMIHTSTPFTKKILGYPIYLYRSKLQRSGIQRSRKIILNTNWFAANLALTKINCTAINLPRIMIYRESHPPSVDLKYSWLSDYDFSIFSPTRHLWATNSDPLPDFIKNGGMKRNDKLINAFAKLIGSGIVQRPLLLLCEYGADVVHSKRLIEELNIAQYVKWLPLVGRRELAVIMRHASVIADQFREGMSATSAGTSNEALACGKPVITNTDGALLDILDPYYSSPILQAVSEQEIYDWLFMLASSPEFVKKIGDEGAKWFDDNLSFGLAQKYINLLSLD